MTQTLLMISFVGRRGTLHGVQWAYRDAAEGIIHVLKAHIVLKSLKGLLGGIAPYP